MLAKRGQAIDRVLNFVVPDSLLVRVVGVRVVVLGRVGAGWCWRRRKIG